MIDIPLWQVAFALALFALAGAALLLPACGRAAQLDARIRGLRDGRLPLKDGERERQALWVRVFSAVGQAVLKSGLLSRKAIADLEETMLAAGHRPGPALPLFLGAKLLLVIGLPVFGWALTRTFGLHVRPMFILPICALVGLMLPDAIVRGIRKRYLAAVETGLPAALDLLIICAEAGLALEASLERVGKEAKAGAAATANELRITANEMKMLSDRRQALTNMGKRTGIESMSRLGGTLAQSLKYGTPLTQALRTLAVEMRQLMLTRYEARAARIPVLLTIPMIVFILPCVFVVVAGPAAVRVMQLMGTR